MKVSDVNAFKGQFKDAALNGRVRWLTRCFLIRWQEPLSRMPLVI